MSFKPCPKIDTHVHFSLHQGPREGRMWISSYDNMLPHMQKLGISKAVLMSSGQTGLPFGGNEDNIAICAADPMHFAWMCNLDPVDPETVYARLSACKEKGAVGIGELMVNRRLDDPFLRALFRAAGELKLPVTFHMSPQVGFSYGVVDDPRLPLLEQAL